ncbi:hypothetical protein [Flavobacterium sp. 11]|uniref:hypothetical protein n=1 Tax=Flavobacterium sp. 11 TaxID=357523 RepID=UPI000C1862DA|nr:hypothetical protein [Flavobacterium sp. 11]PIF62664.1 hypothetical protein CLV00_2316 [Flavobacterium sp. 11]
MNKIKLYEFLGLSEVEQYNAVWSLGVHVDTYIKDYLAINLCVINDFYCEVYFDMKINKILYKKTFKQGELLDKYLNKIKI